MIAAENALLALALAGLAALPLLEIVLRSSLGIGVSGAASFTQHLALVAGMLGAAVAAREDRLLSLSSGDFLRNERARRAARAFTRTVAASTAALLCIAGAELVLAECEAGGAIAYGIPIWLGQAALPLGFAVIALRLALAAGESAWARLGALSVAVAVAAAAATRLPLHDVIALAAMGIILAAAALGSPIFAALGGLALALFWADDLPIAAVALDHYRMVVSPSLPMIPLFCLAGYFLAEGGAPGRMLRVFNALFGGLRGGAAIVTVLACAFFTSFSGASGVTIVALGGMVMPLLAGAGYSQKSALGLLAGAGSLGGMLPPGLPLVFYALVAKVSLEEMFLAGLIPGLLMVALMAAWGVRSSPPSRASRAFSGREALAALLDAKWELLLPVVAFVALFGGFATPVEAAALTAVYAFVVEVFIYRDLDLRHDTPRIMAACGLMVGGILLILGVSLGLSNYLVDAQLPERIVDWVSGAIGSRWVFLLALCAFLLAAGCVLDIFSAIVVLVPLVAPLGVAYGIDPLHLGIVFLACMELGYLTPPVGMNLFFTAYRFERPLPEVFRAALPAAGVLGVAVLVLSAVPWLATALPKLARLLGD